MDKPAVAAAFRTSKAARNAALALIALLLAAAAAFPAVRRWSRADRAIDASAIRTAAVTRGDLRRELSVQARVVAGKHPTLTSPAQGVVRVQTRAGAAIRKGEVLALIESIELRTTLEQAESLLHSMQSELERQKIVVRQSQLRAAQSVELSDPTKLVDVVAIGKQLLMTRGALTTFSISNDVSKYFAIIPAMFVGVYPELEDLNVMDLATPESAILSAVIFNALIIVALIPIALRGIAVRAAPAPQVLRRNLLVYGLGGLVLPFPFIKLIDLVLSVWL